MSDVVGCILILFDLLKNAMDESALVEVDEVANIVRISVFNKGQIREVDSEIRDLWRRYTLQSFTVLLIRRFRAHFLHQQGQNSSLLLRQFIVGKAQSMDGSTVQTRQNSQASVEVVELEERMSSLDDFGVNLDAAFHRTLPQDISCYPRRDLIEALNHAAKVGRQILGGSLSTFIRD